MTSVEAAHLRRDRRRALAAGIVTTVAGVAVMLIHSLGGGPHDNGDPEGWFASIGFAAPFIAAGLLAVLGAVVGAPWHWWTAGCALVPCSVVSIVLFPLLGPAMLLVALGLAHGPSGRRWLGSVLAATLVVSFGIIVFHQDPAEWSGPTGGGGSSNIITTTEATLSVVTAICVLVVAWAVAVASPRPPANAG